MINNPKHGWCDFKLGDFTGHPSYLTNVPVDLLRGFVELFSIGTSSVFFDEEGTEFTLVMTPYSIYIIEEKDSPHLIDLSELNPKEIAKELIVDIRENFIKWCHWNPEDNFYDQKVNLEKLIKDLESKLSSKKKALFE